MSALKEAEKAEFLKDILREPFDEGLRLVYADWCEDNGDHATAGLIRGTIDYGNTKVDLPTGIKCAYRRGFIFRLELSLGLFTPDWVQATFSKYPITEVKLTNRVATQPTSSAPYWYGSSIGLDDESYPHVVPYYLIAGAPDHWWSDTISPYFRNVSDLIKKDFKRNLFRSEEEAQEWLSRRCVNYGRRLAGLPEIYP